MVSYENYRDHRLPRRTLLLSASAPSTESNKYRRIPHAHLEIEEAIISLARATFTRGVNLVFGGRPSISLLLAMVAAEYLSPRFAEIKGEPPEEFKKEHETPLTVYQPTAFQKDFPEIQLLEHLGYVSVNWMASEGPYMGSVELRDMIEKSNPVALVCIGGMDDVEREVNTFLQMKSQSPIYVMGMTGGAAELIAKKGPENIRVIDLKLMHILEERAQEIPTEWKTEEQWKFKYTPYPLIMQKMLQDIFDKEDMLR